MIQAIRGTKDILPEEISRWQSLESSFRKTSALFGYKELRTPIFEKTEVFSRSIGENTDIVNKEMYSFTDRGGESITLRPEMTAALVRSVIQNSLLEQSSTLRLWYFGPFFRYERPQKGRLRQFHQYGAECLGSPNPEADAEVIILADAIIKAAGISQYKLLINTLGTDESRSNFRSELVNYLSIHKNDLSNDSQTRLKSNPMRILDSKDVGDKEIISTAPNILNYLDEQSSQHFNFVKNILLSEGIDYNVEPKLVRGLDYYSHTVFEFQSEHLGSQDSFGGGGRYDSLFAQLGGKQSPAVGFALGVERLLLILENQSTFSDDNMKNDFYIICTDNRYHAIRRQLSKEFRKKGYSVTSDLLRRSMKAQLREANRLNSKYVIIIAENEINNNSVLLKKMSDGTQSEIGLDKVFEYNYD